ncbi:hypothetical protein B0T10DRAFT_455231 [Thelonectria olida]|uniref:Uncharacterized protein n=1 Tax=Thelonectria olida TaxID=1576542 RepID=A0A9P9AXK2_9HYPO|nr:hypothetical protein B0T10DRAFT_455231 [Thelonectria olida]
MPSSNNKRKGIYPDRYVPPDSHIPSYRRSSLPPPDRRFRSTSMSRSHSRSPPGSTNLRRMKADKRGDTNFPHRRRQLHTASPKRIKAEKRSDTESPRPRCPDSRQATRIQSRSPPSLGLSSQPAAQSDQDVDMQQTQACSATPTSPKIPMPPAARMDVAPFIPGALVIRTGNPVNANAAFDNVQSNFQQPGACRGTAEDSLQQSPVRSDSSERAPFVSFSLPIRTRRNAAELPKSKAYEHA